ncbi:hypothetical protein [Maribacter sp. 2-571]|uniref:hypothetical protein n=1 Tax=Maribacter sp. 2-571 TaxID=3417569 RepID=UPI003D33DDB9
MRLRTILGIFCFGVLCCACDDIIEEEDLSNRSVNVLAPVDGSVVTQNQVSFNWNTVEDARSYKFELATPNFENAAQILLDSLIVQDTLGSIRTQLGTTLLNGNYQWRVKALNGGFETPFTTNTFTVDGDENIDLIAPNTPAPITPEDGAVLDAVEVTFTWSREDVAGTAERDSVYIYTDPELQSLERKGLGANKSFETTLSSNTYYWLVQAFDAGGNRSEDSAVFEFTIN